MQAELEMAPICLHKTERREEQGGSMYMREIEVANKVAVLSPSGIGRICTCHQDNTGQVGHRGGGGYGIC